MRSLLPILLITASSLCSQDNRKIEFPDLPEFKTLICDFHIHSVFSDGHVWPTIRVEEAVRDGLDAISLTEHIEYLPWKADMKLDDRNRSYHLATEAAKPHDLIIIHGSEITREMPPGHANAIFITDANALIVEDSIEAYRQAREQGAFIFWNHPNWVSQEEDGIPQLSDTHKMLIEEDLLHGIEVVNDITYSEEALDIALDHGLTAIGTSDIHGLVDWQFNLADGGHRPVNLVFATEKSEEAIKDALFAGRTVSWYNDILIGDEQWVKPLIQSILSFESKGMLGPSSILQVEISNNSSTPILLQNTSEYDFYNHSDIISIPANQTEVIMVLSERLDTPDVVLEFNVLNAVIGRKKNTTISVRL